MLTSTWHFPNLRPHKSIESPSVSCWDCLCGHPRLSFHGNQSPVTLFWGRMVFNTAFTSFLHSPAWHIYIFIYIIHDTFLELPPLPLLFNFLFDRHNPLLIGFYQESKIFYLFFFSLIDLRGRSYFTLRSVVNRGSHHFFFLFFFFFSSPLRYPDNGLSEKWRFK